MMGAAAAWSTPAVSCVLQWERLAHEGRVQDAHAGGRLLAANGHTCAVTGQPMSCQLSREREQDRGTGC
jgi:hypothetical protein